MCSYGTKSAKVYHRRWTATLTFKAPSHKPGELLCKITDAPANGTQKSARETRHYITQLSKEFLIAGLPQWATHRLRRWTIEGKRLHSTSRKIRRQLLICWLMIGGNNRHWGPVIVHRMLTSTRRILRGTQI